MVLLAAALLSGCTPRDHVMAGLVDGRLVFVPCDEIAGVQHISASVSAASGAPTDVWHSRGEGGAFGLGSPIIYGVDPSGFTTDVGPKTFDIASSRIYFSLRNTAVDERTWQIQGNELLEGKWLDENGNVHDQPCS